MTILFPPPFKEPFEKDGAFTLRWKSWFTTTFDYLVGTGQHGSFTLATSVGTTTVVVPNCDTGSVITPTPVTVNAATEAAAGTLYVVAGKGQFVITHVNSATTLRTFKYAIFG